MNGPGAAALLLALALVAYPSSPRRRIAPRGIRSRRPAVLGSRGIGSLAVLLGVPVAALLPWPVLLAVAVAAATAALRYRRRHRLRRAADEGRTLEGALDVLVGELRVGAHPVRAFSVAADETDGAVAASLRAVAARAGLGADVTAGLRDAARTSALPAHWTRLAVCWRLAAEHGLAIATLMRAAQRDIAERQRFSARVSSAMAGARATAAILAALPVLGVLLGQLIGAHPLAFLLGGQAGGWLLLVGSTLTSLGLLWCDRLTDRPAS
ncbi:type II secretion system F family protein [Mycobacterium sp. 050134]|uniref:type II secretion system F family protein n=1 Tax=Mycobacterium sp. 050134 TaxID=3096111 RepID=UPI002ED7766D